MASGGGAAAGRVLRSQATKEKRREEDEESGGDEEGTARREAARRRKLRRKDDCALEEEGLDRKDEGKLDDVKDVPVAANAPRAPGDDGLVDILEPLFLLRNNISTFISKLKPPADAAPTPSPAAPVQQWGALVSQYPQQANVPLTGTVFAIGRSSKCNMQLRELSVSSLLCNLVWQDGSALIECCSNSGILSVNSRTMKKGARQTLKNGDEIAISGLKPYSFIYQQLPTPQFVPASAGISVPGSPGQSQPQAAPVALNLSTSAVPTPAAAGTEQAPKLAIDADANGAAKPRKRWLFSDSNSDGDASVNDADAPFSIRDSTAGLKLPRSLTSWPNLPIIPPSRESSGIPASSSGTMLPSSANNSASAMVSPSALSSSTTVVAETPKVAHVNHTKDLAKEEFLRSVVNGKNMAVSFDKFPYYLSDDVKRQLINCVYVYLLRPELGKFTAELPTVSRRILLSGPAGTEMYQETLARALAHHFQANLLVFDPAKIAPLDAASSGSSTSASESRPLLSSVRHTDNIDDADADLWQLDGKDRRQFRKGDKVKFVGPAFSSAVTGIFRQLHTIPERREPRGPPPGAKGKVMVTFDENNRRVGVRFDKPVPGGNSLGGLCEDSHGFFTDAAELRHDAEGTDSADGAQLEALFDAVNESQPCILFLRDADKCIAQSYDRYAIFRRLLDRVSGRAVVIGSSVVSDGNRRDKNMSPGLLLSKGSGGHTTLLDFSFLDHFSRLEERSNRETSKQARILARVLPTKVAISAPTDAGEQARWKKQIEKDVETLKLESNHLLIRRVIERNSIDAPVLPDHKLLKEQVLPLESVEKIVGYAVSHHAMGIESTDISGDRLCLPLEALTAGVEMLNSAQAEPPNQRALRDIETENEFEKRLLAEVIPPADIGVRFDDIGALDSVKETLRELVMLPLQRPELFRKGALTRPCKGILMFGPPGTGKTMLARAVATESGANFINLSMSSIASKWFGEGEKFARAVFTLASKISPSVIFIDEVDSILGKRERHGEHEAMRKIKNEFMSMWDGLKTKENERVLVLAATNRPFDLDDAVLRRMPRRLLVDLPDAVNREKILRVLLAKEDISEGFDYAAVAQMTEGYSGSDLKSLCVAAAYIPIREILEREKKDNVREAEPVIRKLTLEDFKRAKNDICASVSEDAFSIGELRKWNEMYGEGGKRGMHSRLSYFM